MTRCPAGGNICAASLSASPMAVAPLGRELRRVRRSRLVIGAERSHDADAPANEMMPIRVPGALSRMNAWAAAFAACARVGRRRPRPSSPTYRCNEDGTVAHRHRESEMRTGDAQNDACERHDPKRLQPAGIHCRGLAASTKNARWSTRGRERSRAAAAGRRAAQDEYGNDAGREPQRMIDGHARRKPNAA